MWEVQHLLLLIDLFLSETEQSRGLHFIVFLKTTVNSLLNRGSIGQETPALDI
jgi:hypothetical protein